MNGIGLLLIVITILVGWFWCNRVWEKGSDKERLRQVQDKEERIQNEKY